MRIYFDENFSPALIEGLRRIQDGRRSDDITVCSVIEEFGKSSPDETWIPEVAKKHGAIITQDLNISRLKAQWQLCQVNRIGVFFVKPPKKGWSYWDIVRLIIGLWSEITKTAKECPRPAMRINQSRGKLAVLIYDYDRVRGGVILAGLPGGMVGWFENVSSPFSTPGLPGLNLLSAHEGPGEGPDSAL